MSCLPRASSRGYLWPSERSEKHTCGVWWMVCLRILFFELQWDHPRGTGYGGRSGAFWRLSARLSGGLSAGLFKDHPGILVDDLDTMNYRVGQPNAVPPR